MRLTRLLRSVFTRGQQPHSPASTDLGRPPMSADSDGVNCPACGVANTEGARYCLKCGASFATNCPNCSAELTAGAVFCSSCGQEVRGTGSGAGSARLQQYIPKELLAKLEAAQASGGMQGERRIVTMLFCDVSGSTAAAGKLDPEEWAEIINGAFDLLIAPVYRYEGTLARLMGDAILAFFGAPIAHEDDPQRAVLAGLDIIQGIEPYREQVQSKWGLDLQVRVGINTGLVVVGEVGSDLRVEYTALGDAINLAARMEQTAQPGTVQLTDDTRKLIAPLFEFEDLGGIDVKGKSEPVQAYQVLRAKSAPGRLRGIEGLDAPMVGRDAELVRLREIIAGLRQGQGRIVSLMGEAGLGKSRLIAELRHALSSDGLLRFAGVPSGLQIGWYEGRCISFEGSTPYTPFLDLLNRYFGFRPEQGDSERYDIIKAHVLELIPDRVEEATPFLAFMLGIELSGEAEERLKYLQPPQVRDRVFRATVDFLDQLAQSRPLVLVFDDLHWSDPTSLDLLEHLMPLTDRAPMVIIGLFRPLQQEPSWRFHETAERDYAHRYSAIRLEPLNEDYSRDLVAGLLHVEDLPERVRQLILSKAEGNPFFVEEVIRSLLDARLVVRENSHWRATQEIENIALPDTLSGVITARLDRLAEEPKRVAQTASVIGREFQFTTLADVHGVTGTLPEALTDLQQKELIRERTTEPQHVYLFKHALTQETAYSSLLLSRRRELHRRVGECLEQIEPDRAGEISRHYLEAREEVRALPYLVQAADEAARAYSTVEAIRHYTRAIEILGTVKDQGLARPAREGLGAALTFGNDVPRAVENYHAMLHEAKEYGDLPMQVSALNKLGFVTALMRGQFPEAEDHLVDAERLASQCGDLAGLAELHMTYCYLRVPFGQFDDAIEHLSESARIGRELDISEARLFGMTHTANTLMYMTRFDDGWQATQAARDLAEELGNSMWLSELMGLPSPIYHIRNGDLEAASHSAEEGARLAARIGASEAEAYGCLMQGQVAWFRGDFQRAIACHESALRAGQAAGFPFLQAAALCGLGTAYLNIGGNYAERGTELQAQAMEFMEQPMGEVMGGLIWADIGFCAVAGGDPQRAGEMFQKGLTVSTATSLLARPALLVGSAFVELGRGNVQEAGDLAREAREFAEERQMKHFYPLVELAEAQVAATGGGGDLALEHLARAEKLALEMGMRALALQARLGAVQLLEDAGESKEAQRRRDEARALVEEIAGMFEDQGLRDAYLETAAKSLT